MPGTGTLATQAAGGAAVGAANPRAANASNSGFVSAGYSCNPDWGGIAQIGARVAWSPVKNPVFSTEVMYTNLLQNMVGQAYMNTPATSGRNSGVYDFANQGTIGGYLRVERQF
jgi:hypothetical protein